MHDAFQSAAAAAAVASTNGNGTPSAAVDDLLRMTGYLALRGQIIGVAQQAGAIKPEIYDAAIQFATQARDRARLEGAADAQLDDLDNQLRALRAVRKLRAELGRIDSDAAARRSVRV